MSIQKPVQSFPTQKGWNPKGPTELPPKSNRKKVNFQVQEFDTLINKQGVRVFVYRTSFCPNVKSIDGAEHELDCPLCHGTGFIDRYPLDTWAFLQSFDLDKGVFAEGLYDGNSMAGTFQQSVELQYFTLVELQDFSETFFERIKRQDGQVDVLRYPGTRVNLVIDKHGKEYFEGNDFKLDPNGNISWCDGRQPDRGAIYSVNYSTKIRFRAIKAMHNNRFVQVGPPGETDLVKMSEQWMLQKEYLVARVDQKGKPIKPNKIRDSDDADDDLYMVGQEYTETDNDID
jgi:hypothetical protein